MDKRLAEKLIQNFDFRTMEVFNEYLEEQIAIRHRIMEAPTSNIDFIRGEISALRLLGKIRDHAVLVTSNKD